METAQHGNASSTTEPMDVTQEDCDPILITGEEHIACASDTCQNDQAPSLHFYKFPREPQRCKAWVENCGNSKLFGKPAVELNQTHYLCSLHFDTSQFQRGDDCNRLIPEAVPTLFSKPPTVQHLEVDHDYLMSPPNEAPGDTHAVVSRPTIVRVSAPQGVSILKSGIPAPKKAAVQTVVATRQAGSPSNSSPSSKTGTAKNVEPPVKSPTVTVQEKPPITPAQQKQPVAFRRLVPSTKETPLQKYMLLCAELKSDLKSVNKQKRDMEVMFSGVQDLLLQEAKVLRAEDAALLAGTLLKFQKERYRREPSSIPEKALYALCQKQKTLDPHKPMKRPVTEIAVFVVDDSLPDHVVLGRRKDLLGGGLYQVPCGEIEFGETWEEAAYREVLESTAMHVHNIAVCSIVDTVEHGAGYHSVTVFMRGVVDASHATLPQPVQPDRCDSWHWRPWQELPTPSELFWPLRDYKLEGLKPFP